MGEKHFLTELKTRRLFLRKFRLEDAAAISELLRHREVPATTLKLPYPCGPEEAKKLIENFLLEQNKKSTIRWAITKLENNELIGGLRLAPIADFNSAELGFWTGKDYWRKGYTFEAANRILQFAFYDLQLNRLNAHAMTENLPSLNLLVKLGFRQEGVHPELVMKWDNYKDVITFGLLRKHYENREID